MRVVSHFHSSVKTAFGLIDIGWSESADGLKVTRIYLPNQSHSHNRDIKEHSTPVIDELREQIQNFLEGAIVHFNLSIISLDRCTDFQRKVLLVEKDIPRGWVSTYGRIANRLKTTGGARAVGNALSNNPFPLIIPCHRVVQADGRIGGYQGGLKMKEALLRLEGVEITHEKKVVMDKIYY